MVVSSEHRSIKVAHIYMLHLRRMASLAWKPRYFDIGVNFSDSMFQGRYNGSSTEKHPADVDKVIQRAQLFNVRKMLITASSIDESESHFELVSQYKGAFGSTVGVHPCTVAQEFYGGLENVNPLPEYKTKLDRLKQLTEEGVAKGFVKAFGEIGLDYDRLHYSSVHQQKESFHSQLQVIASLKHLRLPLFLHMRSACDDFVDIIRPFIDAGDIEKGNGVVHSFTGTSEELAKILELGFYVGVNGCSLKTEENLEVAKLIPKEKLLIETDAPWCEIRKSHASYPFLSPYPNLFYPEISIPYKEEIKEEQANGKEGEAKKEGKKKAKPQPKQQQIKLDETLPFPSIKKENFHKHEALVQQKLENIGECPTDLIGEFAYPLIKSRNEPVFVGSVAEIMAHLYGIKDTTETQEFVDLVYENSCKLFRL